METTTSHPGTTGTAIGSAGACHTALYTDTVCTRANAETGKDDKTNGITNNTANGTTDVGNGETNANATAAPHSPGL